MNPGSGMRMSPARCANGPRRGVTEYKTAVPGRSPAVSGVRRVIAGVSGSPGSLQAIRYAAHLARDHHAGLVPVLAWMPPGGDFADRSHPSPYLRQLWHEAARLRLQRALELALGGVPQDLSCELLVQRGEAGAVLVRAASCDGDVLVIGTGRRGAARRL